MSKRWAAVRIVEIQKRELPAHLPRSVRISAAREQARLWDEHFPMQPFERIVTVASTPTPTPIITAS